jgi:hypothetical protein
VSPVASTTADNSSLITTTDPSVLAPATQPACGNPPQSPRASAVVGAFKTPINDQSQPPFSPVARNTRQKKPITQAPQAPVDKQWAGGKQ